jgi:hypothetical protein
MQFTYSIVGSSGLIGNSLLAQTNNSKGYNRVNIANLATDEHDVLVIAAPSGNRVKVNQNSSADYSDCQTIVDTVKISKYNKLVHVSTVDVFVNSSYGLNRQFLENELSKLPNSYTVRLPSIISPHITKNVIHDLKHNIWLDKVSLDSQLQWYPLNRLKQDIETVLTDQIKTVNLVSPPVANREIVHRYFKNLITNLEHNQIPSGYYDVRNNESYWIPICDVWDCLDNYFLK